MNRPTLLKLLVGLTFCIGVGLLMVGGLQLKQRAVGLTYSPPQQNNADSSVLGANNEPEEAAGSVSFNLPSIFQDTGLFKKTMEVIGTSIFRDDITVDNKNVDLGTGELTAANVVYQVVGGPGITVSGDGQRPVISSTAATTPSVNSVQGTTGTITFVAGSGVRLDGLTITNTAPDTDQNVFQNIAVSGQSPISPGSTTDTLTLAGSGGINLVTDPTNKTVTISTSNLASGWSDNGSTVNLTTGSDSVGVGTNNPGAKVGISATSEQLRLTYTDGSVYSSFTVDATGDVTISPTGGDLNVNGNANVGTNGFVGSQLAPSGSGALTVGSGQTTNLTLQTDGVGDAEVVLPDGSIASTEILDDTILEVDFHATNTPAGGQCLAYDAGSGGFSWVACSAGVSLFTDAGSVTHLTDTAEDFAVGGSTLAGAFSVDVSANTTRIGTGSGSNAVLGMFASDGDTGTVTYTTNDAWAFENGAVVINSVGSGGNWGLASASVLSVNGTSNQLRLIYGDDPFNTAATFSVGNAGDLTINAALLNAPRLGVNANMGSNPFHESLFGVNLNGYPSNAAMIIATDGSQVRNPLEIKDNTTANLFYVTATGGGYYKNNLGVNTTGPDRKLDVLDASNPQLRLSQTDGTVYSEFQVDGSGNLIVTATGGDVTLPTGAIASAEVLDDTILEVDLHATNSAAGGQCLVYDTGSGGFSWATCSSGSGSFTDGGATTYLTDTTDDFAVGGTTLASAFSVDVSANTARIGTGSSTDATLQMFAANGATGSITYTTGDGWSFTGGTITSDSTVTATDFICTDCLDFTELADTLTLDAGLILNQGTNTWTQNFTATTTTGLTYNANSLTTGTAVSLASSSTAFSTGALMNLSWTPGSATNATGDLFAINIGPNGNVGNLFVVKDNGSTLFNITESAATSNVPFSFNAPGDVAVAYDLQFTNQTQSSIKTKAPLYLEVGDSFESNDLTLRTFNNGDVVFDAPGGVTLVQAQTWDLADSSTSSLSVEAGLLQFDTQNSRIGVGTTGPDRKLDVLDASNPQLRLTQADGSVYAEFQVDASGNLTSTTTGSTVTFSGDTISATDFSCTDCLDFNELADTMTLDAASSNINFGANTLTFNQSGAGNLIANLASTGDFLIRDNGTTFVTFNDSGNSVWSLPAANFVQIDAASTDTTTTAGVVDVDIDSSTNGNVGFYVDYQDTNTGATSTFYSFRNDITIDANATGNDTVYGYYSAFTQTDAAATANGIYITGEDQNYLSGVLGVGTTGPDRKLDVLDASNPQLRLTQADGTVYAEFQVDGSGNLTSTTTGSTVTFSGDTVSATDFTCTDCLDFAELEDTLDLDAGLTLNQSTNAWVQNFTGTTTTGLTYNANSLTSGKAVSFESTSTAFSSGTMMNVAWTPGSSTAATGDLFAITLGSNGNVGNLFVVKDGSSSLFSITESGIASNLPHSFTAAGDVGVAYDLLFGNQTSSYIKSNAPLTLEVGESFESNDLKLKTYNNGDLVLDLAGGVTFAQAQAWDLADASTTSLNIESGLFNIDTQNSRIGIGTAAPSKTLDVTGAMELNLPGTTTTNGLCHTTLTGTTNEEVVDCSGAPGDVAEWYAVESNVEPGDVVSLGGQQISYQAQGADAMTGHVTSLGLQKINVLQRAKSSSDVAIGIVSTGPFQVFGEDIKDHLSKNPKVGVKAAPIALNGRVPVNVSTANGTINAGDPLAASNVAGVAVKALTPGSIVARALEPFSCANGSVCSGKVLALMTHAWFDPGTDTTFAKAHFDQQVSLEQATLARLTVDQALVVHGSAEFNGDTIFNKVATFVSGAVLGGQVEFDQTPVYGGNTAGEAVVPVGKDRVKVTFANAYSQPPLIHATIGSGSSADAEVVLLQQGYTYAVAERSVNSFVIVLNKPAVQDLHFAWFAVSLSDTVR